MRYPRIALALAAFGCGRVGFGVTADGDPDGSLGEPSCDGIDVDTIALYEFVSLAGIGDDASGQHPGVQRGIGALTVGATGCANAFLIADAPLSYVLVADDPAWQLEFGSVELLFRLPPAGGVGTLIARDADGTDQGGHFGISFFEGTLYVRLQQVADVGGGLFRCSETLADNRWHSVLVNFGAPDLEMFVDGALADRTDDIALPYGTFPCGVPGIRGLKGNSNAWIFGGDNGDAPESDPDPAVTSPFAGGAIDHVRISAARR